MTVVEVLKCDSLFVNLVMVSSETTDGTGNHPLLLLNGLQLLANFR